MEKYLVHGSPFNDKNKVLSLRLPLAKKFSFCAVKNAEVTTYPGPFINYAVEKKKYQDTHIYPHAWVDGQFLSLPKTLQELLVAHPFPLSQGPVLRLPLDSKKSSVMNAKTLLLHPSLVLSGSLRWWEFLLGQINFPLTGLVIG